MSDKKNKKESKDEKSKLEKKIEELKKENQEYLEGWQRAKADFLNFKNKEAERIKEVIDFANQELILKILPILDNLDLAEKNLTKKEKNNEYIKGILQIKRQFQDILKEEGVEEIKTEGQKFDPNFHKVTEQIKKDNLSSGKIVEEIKKGYTLNGKVIRPAEVKVVK